MKKLNGFSNIVLVVIIVILIGGVGYFAFVKESCSLEAPDLMMCQSYFQKVIRSFRKPISANPIKTSVSPTPNLSLPATCKDETEGTPVITSLSSYSGSVGTKFEIKGCNFLGFEGDKNAWIVNTQGIKGILYGEARSTSKLLKVTLKSPLCQKDTSYSGLSCDTWLTLTPGAYKIYTAPWGKESNKVDFTIK